MIAKILHELQNKYELSVDLMIASEEKNMKSFSSCYLGRSQAYKDAIEIVQKRRERARRRSNQGTFGARSAGTTG